ncbi:enoyl-CoA hydratase [Paucibacter sp. KBW04]|uniref:enoyl-CoA hydratase/isomerase family protein n=1 Tax=Paucibacter sp. KBW04 TaxID=2153361 RepID=UPI000F5798CD|nr:enoyl-CoA hydratase/isomerase family protein [Paucibacter sp. KBW04]RQO55505.1 enoyl-CoA hydratase [Paucibacter sp. KBW04]
MAFDDAYQDLSLAADAQLGAAVLHLIFNRPSLRNALSQRMVAELRRALAEAEAGGVVRVIVLRGAGGHFCAGADLADMSQARALAAEQGPAPLAEANASFGYLCQDFARSGLATVAVLEGSVMGGGFGLACVADLVLASETVQFRLPETALGLIPAQIAPFLIERLGVSQARRLAVTGARVGAQEAQELGLVHKLYASAQLEAAIAQHVREILQCAPRALAASKALLALAQPRADLVEQAAQLFAQAALGSEGLEGVAAFVERRKPRWSPA